MSPACPWTILHYTTLSTMKMLHIPHKHNNTFIDWENDWQMQFNMRECNVMGMGRNSENRDYMMQGEMLECITQKDLGVVIDICMGVVSMPGSNG